MTIFSSNRHSASTNGWDMELDAENMRNVSLGHREIWCTSKPMLKACEKLYIRRREML